jgi:hypothetical protein
MIRFVVSTGFILLGIMTACNQSPKSGQNHEAIPNSATKETVNLLMGSWVQPNPINEQEVQGFSLQPDSTAQSINMATLLYKKWWMANGKLVLVAESIGNRQSSMDTTAYEIVPSSADSLVLKSGDYVEKYRRQ